MNSIIKITFNSIPILGDSFSISRLVPSSASDSFVQTFVYSSPNVDQTVIGGDTYSSATNLVSSLLNQFPLDYLQVYRIDNEVYIEGLPEDIFVLNYNTTARDNLVISVINASESETNLSLVSTIYSEASTNKCDTVNLKITTNLHVDSYIINNVETQNSPDGLNYFTINLPRGFGDVITVKGNGNSLYITLVAPVKLLLSKFTINTQSAPLGSYIGIFNTQSSGLSLSYSLNNTAVWQSSSSFKDVAPGVGVIKVKDGLGCEIEIPYESIAYDSSVSGLGDFFVISDSMPIRFKRNVEWDSEEDIKNDSNSLSYEDDLSKNYNHTYSFLPKNLLRMQFLSNHEINNVSIKQECNKSALPVAVPVTMVKKFIDLKIKIECSIYKAPNKNGNLGIYFTSGNILDYDTSAIIEGYVYNESIPSFCSIGQLVDVSGIGLRMITDIIYDSKINKEVAILDSIYSGPTVNSVVSIVYDENNFNVYEFEVDMSLYVNNSFYLDINVGNEEEIKYNYISEGISVFEELPGYIELEWDYENCQDVISVVPFLGVGYHLVDSKSQDTKASLETNDVYTGAQVVDFSNYSIIKVKLDPLPHAICRQLLKSLSTSSEIRSASLPYPGEFTLSEVPQLSAATPYLTSMEISLLYY